MSCVRSVFTYYGFVVEAYAIMVVICSQNIRLHFLKFDLEYGGHRWKRDNVEVYDVDHGSNFTLRGKYCGTKIPADRRTKMVVIFTTDNTVTKSGFRIHLSEGKAIFLYT